MAGVVSESETPRRSDVPFFAALSILGGTYVVLIVAMLAADASFTSPVHIWCALANENIRFAIKLSLISCSITTILSLWVAVPLGYSLSRWRFPGKPLLDALLDIPIVLPPLVVGLSLLILFQTPPGRAIERVVPVTYAVPSVILRSSRWPAPLPCAPCASASIKSRNDANRWR